MNEAVNNCVSLNDHRPRRRSSVTRRNSRDIYVPMGSLPGEVSTKSSTTNSTNEILKEDVSVSTASSTVSLATSDQTHESLDRNLQTQSTHTPLVSVIEAPLAATTEGAPLADKKPKRRSSGKVGKVLRSPVNTVLRTPVVENDDKITTTQKKITTFSIEDTENNPNAGNQQQIVTNVFVPVEESVHKMKTLSDPDERTFTTLLVIAGDTNVGMDSKLKVKNKSAVPKMRTRSKASLDQSLILG